MYKVMIVDDRDIVRLELKRLKIWGASSGFVIVKEAQNGQEALNILENIEVDLVITDIKMPKVDGIELLRTIVDKKLCSCVVLLSDFSEFSYARQGIILGAFDYIPKPINEQELLDLLQRARVYLDNIGFEKERIKKLEENHNERGLRLQTHEMNTLIELILMEDERSLLQLEQLIYQIGEHYHQNSYIKFAGLLKNSLHDIITELIKVYPYLELFIDTAVYNDFTESNPQDGRSLLNLFIDKAKKLNHIIQILRLNLQDKGIVKQVCNFVLQHIDQNISLSIVAEQLFMNKTYISESFKQKMGISFTEYVTIVKMERAKILITKDELKTYEIAEKLGYKDTEYFSKVFKKRTGFTPTEYKNTCEMN